MSYSSRYGGGSYGSFSRYSTERSVSFFVNNQGSRRDSTGYGSGSGGGSYRKNSGTSRDYSSSRYSSKYDTGSSASPRSYDYTSSRYSDPEKFKKYRQSSKDAIEKSYDETPAKPEEVVVEAHLQELGTEVLQESDVDHFSPEPTVVENVEEALSYTRSEPDEEPESIQEPVPEPSSEPVYVTETSIRRTSLCSPNENSIPEPMLGSGKKLGGSVWPPRDEDNLAKQKIAEEGGPGKKRVSDLIARFNSGAVENESNGKTDQRYKQEYGASGRGGKVQQSVFQ